MRAPPEICLNNRNNFTRSDVPNAQISGEGFSRKTTRHEMDQAHVATNLGIHLMRVLRACSLLGGPHSSTAGPPTCADLLLQLRTHVMSSAQDCKSKARVEHLNQLFAESNKARLNGIMTGIATEAEIREYE